MPRTPDFFADMTRADLEALEAFAREPKNRLTQVHEWLLAHGFRASRSATQRWLKKFRETDRMSEAAELADAIHSAASNAGAVDVAGAVNLQLAQRLQSALVQGGDKLAIGDLLKGAMAINALTNAQGKVEELKARGREQMEKLKSAVQQQRAITPEMIESVSKAVFG